MTDCGQGPCRDVVEAVATRLESVLSRQHDQGIQTIKDMMTLHQTVMQNQITEMKQEAAKHSTEIFNRLRTVESTQKVQEATAMTEQRVKSTVSDVLGSDSGVTWARSQSTWSKAVWLAISTAAIIASLTIILQNGHLLVK